MWKKIKIGIAVILAIIVVIISFQNRDSVETKLLFATVTMPRAALLFLTLVIGYVCGALTVWSLSARVKPEEKDPD